MGGINVRAYGIDLSEVNLKQYALNNGLNANLSSMTQAEKATLRYQYAMARSTEIMNDFSRTSSSWHNQIVLLKGSFADLGKTVGGVFVNMLKPALRAMNIFMQAVNTFALTISNALGKIFGWKYEEGTGGLAEDLGDASDYADDLASGTGKAAKNAKELKRQLQGFDELNNLTSNDDNGSSGKGSGSGGSVGGVPSTGEVQGQWVREERAYESFINDLYGLGDYISVTLTRTLNNIPWDEVYQGARNFGTGLADFLNGLINPGIFDAVGKTIAGSLNTVIYSSLSFAQTFDFTNFGKSIGIGINRFFLNTDWKALGMDFNAWANGILDGLIAGLDTVNWELVGESIGDFLKELDLANIATKLVTVAGKILDGLLTALKTSFDEEPFGTTLLALFGLVKLGGVGSLLGGNIISGLFTWLTLGKTKDAFKGVGKNITNLIGSPITISIVGVWAGIQIGSKVGKKVNSYIEKIARDNYQDELADYYKEYPTVLQSVPELYNMFNDSYKENGINGIKEDLSGAAKEFKKEMWDDRKEAIMNNVFDYSGGSGGKFWTKEDVQTGKAFLSNISKVANVVKLIGSSKNLATDKVKNYGKAYTSLKDVVTYTLEKIGISSDSFNKQLEKNSEASIKRNERIKNSYASNLGSVQNIFSSAMSFITGNSNKTANKFVDDTNKISNNAGNMATTVSSQTATMSSNSRANFELMNLNAIDKTTLLKNGVTSLFSETAKNTINSSKSLSDGATGSFNGLWSNVNKIFGSYIPSEIAKGLYQANQDSSQYSTNILTNTSKNFGDLWTNANIIFGGRIPKEVRDGMKAAEKEIRNQNWINAGINLVEGLKNGISSKWTSGSGNLLSHVVTLAKDLTDKIRKAFGIHSPSRVWANDVGQYLPLGLARGLDATSPIAMKSVQSLASDMTGMLDKSFVNVNPFERMELQASAIKTDLNSQISVQSGNITADLSASMNSSQSEQNALLRQQNELLTRILEKETGISKKDIFDSVRSESRSYYNQTGKNALVY